MLKKLKKKYASVKDEMLQWEKLQSQLLSQFGNASSIVNRLQLLEEDKNYDVLAIIPGIKDRLFFKQMEALETIFFSMKDTMKEFHRIVMSFDKIERDAVQLLKGSTSYQRQLNVGMQPSLQQHLDGLKTFHEMHKSEHLLKSDIISSLTMKYFKCRVKDIADLGQLLADQPNIPKDEVETLFLIMLPDEDS